MTASADTGSHPVEIECPSCGHRFRVPIKGVSVGGSVPCHSCKFDILIATCTIRQLLQQIDTDLRTHQDLPILLRPPVSQPADIRNTAED